MRGIKTEGKEIPLLQMQWQKESIPIRPHWGQKASRKVGPKQTLTNGNCKAKRNDEPKKTPPNTKGGEIPEEQSNRTICLPPPFVYHPWVGHVHPRQTLTNGNCKA